MNGEPESVCPRCNCLDWDWANIGFTRARQCTNCGKIYIQNEKRVLMKEDKPWVEITKGQIDDCLKHSDNYDFAWAIEAVCKKNNGY